MKLCCSLTQQIHRYNYNKYVSIITIILESKAKQVQMVHNKPEHKMFFNNVLTVS